MKSQVIKIQLALFFQENILRPDNVSSEINKNFKNLFDAMPLVIPIPSDAPSEIPIVQMRSESNKEYSCNIARSRVDFHFNPEKQISDFSEYQKEYDILAKKFISAVLNSVKPVRINRIGFVVQYFIEDNSPTTRIKQQYIAKELGDLNELTVRFNKKKYVGDIKVNDITEIQTSKITRKSKDMKGILVQRDFNNVVEKNKWLDLKLLGKLLNQGYYFSTKKFIEGEILN